MGALGERSDGGAHLGTGERHEQVAQQHCRAVPVGCRVTAPARRGVLGGVLAMRRGQSAAGEGRIDDIVVNQGAGLIELERRSEMRGGGAGHEPVPLMRLRTGRAQRETDGAEHCTHPLARGYESVGRIEQFVGGGDQVGPSASMSVYHLNESDADSGAHRPKGRGETIHGDQRNWAEPGRTRPSSAELRAGSLMPLRWRWE